MESFVVRGEQNLHNLRHLLSIIQRLQALTQADVIAFCLRAVKLHNDPQYFLPKRTLRRMAPIGAYAFREDAASHDGTNTEKDGSVDVESVDVARIAKRETRTIRKAFAHASKTFSTRAAFPEAWFAGGAPGRGGSFALVGTGGEVVEVRGGEKKKRKR